MKKTLLLAGLAGMVAANAEAINVTPYVGLDANYAIVHGDASTKGYLSSKDWSLSGLIGARNDHFGVEAFYNTGLEENKEDVSTRISGFGVDVLGYQQLGCSGRWELVGSAGIGYYTLKAKESGIDEDGPYSASEKDHGYGERLGAGVQYALSENTTVRAMYHHTWIHSSRVDGLDEFTVGIRYAF